MSFTMKKTAVLVCAIVLLCEISESFAKCRILQTIRSVAQYQCDSLQSLKEEGNSSMREVEIYNDKLAPTLTSSIFQKTRHIKRLVLQRSIGDIEIGAFRNLKALAHLSLSKNEIRAFKIGVFANLPVEYLDLSYNDQISTLDPGTFSNLTNLKTLHIRSCNIRRVKAGVFNGLPVTSLGLSKNRISVLENHCFDNLTNLERLHLDGNLLTEFKSEILLNQGNTLQILWLHNNSLTEVSRDVVKGLHNLRLLNLQDNIISKIKTYTFEYAPNLEVLVLSNNSLTDIDADVFPEDGMAKLTKLYLNDNRFSYLTTTVLGKWRYLKGIRIGGNPWQCSCLEIIERWLSDHSVKQNCDKEYLNGSIPLCIIRPADTLNCVYENDHSYYISYRRAIEKYRKNRPCAL